MDDDLFREAPKSAAAAARDAERNVRMNRADLRRMTGGIALGVVATGYGLISRQTLTVLVGAVPVAIMTIGVVMFRRQQTRIDDSAARGAVDALMALSTLAGLAILIASIIGHAPAPAVVGGVLTVLCAAVWYAVTRFRRATLPDRR